MSLVSILIHTLRRELVDRVSFCRSTMAMLITLWVIFQPLVAEESWNAAKLRDGSVPYGRLNLDGSISVEGYFERMDTTYRVRAERDQLVELTDGVRFGWVPKSRLIPVEPEKVRAPEFPTANCREKTPSTRHFGLLGHRVFYRDEGVAMIGDRLVEKERVLEFPATVEDLDGDWLWLGRAWMKRSDVDNSVEYFAKAVIAVHFQPKSAAAWRSRAMAWGAKAEWRYAVKDLTRAIEIEPHDAANWVARGNAKIQIDELASAIEDLTEAIRLQPDYGLAYLGRGMAKETSNQFHEAIADYEKAIELDPENVKAWFGKANSKSAMGNHEEAVMDYNRCIEIDPRMAAAWNNRGIRRKHRGDMNEAIADFDEALRIFPRFTEALTNRGIARFDVQDFHAAIQDYDRAIAIDPSDSSTFNNRGNAKHALKDYPGAIADRDEAVRIDPSNALAYMNRGVSKFLSKDYVGALADYDQAIRIDSQLVNALANKALLLATLPIESMQDAKVAVGCAEKALAIDPSNGYALNAMACAVALSGDFDGAIEWESKAILVPGYVADQDIDGGVHAPLRIERWKQKMLWLLPRRDEATTFKEAPLP